MRGSWRPNRTATYWPHSYGHQRGVFLVLQGCSTEPRGLTPPDAGVLYRILSLTHLISNSIGSPQGPFCWVLAFSPTSFLQLVWLQLTDFLFAPSYIIVQSPTQSLEWHVWSSSSGNNCHAVQRSLSSSASVSECIMGFLPYPISSGRSAYAISSHNCHRNVLLPSGVSLWNGMFGWVEGEYTTVCFRNDCKF